MAGGPQKLEEKTEKNVAEKNIHKDKEPMIALQAQKTGEAIISEKVGIVNQQVRHAAEIGKKIDAHTGTNIKPAQNVHLGLPAVVLPSAKTHESTEPPLQLPVKSPLHQPAGNQLKTSFAPPRVQLEEKKMESGMPGGDSVMKVPPLKKPALHVPTISSKSGKEQVTMSLMQKSYPKNVPSSSAIKKGASKPPQQKPAIPQKIAANPSNPTPMHDDQSLPPDYPPPPPPDSNSSSSGGSQLTQRRNMMFGAHLTVIDLFAAEPRYAGIARRFTDDMHQVMRDNEGCFLPGSQMTLISGQTVAFGLPMLVGGGRNSRSDYVIPLYVTTGGSTQLIIAYMSQSQAIWRRFAGCNSRNHYYKGITEHFQALDISIQKQLDVILGHCLAAGNITRMGSISLRSFGLIADDKLADYGKILVMVTEGEKILQKRIANDSVVWNPKDPNQLPSKVVDSWIVSHDEGVYGEHLNLIIRSADGTIDYCIAVTEDGMFVKYIQGAGNGRISEFGSAPAIPEIPRELNWLFTPIIEYDSQAGRLKPDQPKATRRMTLVTGLDGREKIRRMHEADSPLAYLHACTAPLAALIRLGRINEARDMAVDGLSNAIAHRYSPPEPDLEMAAGLAKTRQALLFEAYSLYSTMAPDVAEARMGGMGLSPREIFLLRRYWNGRTTVHKKDELRRIKSFMYDHFQGPGGESAMVDLFLKNYHAYVSQLTNRGAEEEKTAVEPDFIDIARDLFESYEINRKQRFSAEALEWAMAKLIAEPPIPLK